MTPIKNNNKVVKLEVEHFTNMAISSLNVVPMVGGVLSSSISSYLTSRRFEHVEEVLNAMGERLDKLSPSGIEKVFASDEFMHLFINVIEKAQKEHRKKKRRFYGTMLANMACQEKFQYDLFNHFVFLLDEIGEVHMAIILELEKRGGDFGKHQETCNFKRMVEVCAQLSPTPTDEIISSALQKLVSFGIVKTQARGVTEKLISPTTLWTTSAYAITPSGMQFIEFLKDDKDIEFLMN